MILRLKIKLKINIYIYILIYFQVKNTIHHNIKHTNLFESNSNNLIGKIKSQNWPPGHVVCSRKVKLKLI